MFVRALKPMVLRAPSMMAVPRPVGMVSSVSPVVPTAAFTTVPKASKPSTPPVLAYQANGLARMVNSEQYHHGHHSSGPTSTWMPLLAASVGVTGLLVQEALAEEKEDPKWAAVRKDIEELMDSNLDYDDGSYGPVLVRLAWHCAGTYNKHDGTGGSNGANMRFSPEADHGANAGLHIARQKLEEIKKKHPDISYADLYTFAGKVAIETMGGPTIPWKPGRTDSNDNSKCTPDGRLPDAEQKADHLRDIFYRMGFNDQEIVALSGAHALGRCHTDRSGFDGPWTRAPTTFSNEFFRLLLEADWQPRNWSGPPQYENVPEKDLMMLRSDLALVEDPEFRKHVETYSKDEAKFFADFADAFGKLLELGVPRGSWWNPFSW